MRIPTRRIRILVQALVFALWVSLIWVTRHPLDSWLAKHVPVSLFLRMDPLVTTVVCGGMRLMVTITLLGLVTMAVSVILGRVFCGWVCPLGTVFDAYGWILRVMKVKFQGPSPRWFTLKYYLLAIILVFAVFGGVSPLMGLDPIVLITRTAATVLNPFFLRKDQLLWTVADNPAHYGAFVDVSTLILFMGIMGATTRLSRIWCRTACPLGAYLAVLSRNAILRRDTKDCIHCNLCATHCPTGAIDFRDERVYNESECIKCFSCTQVCPVDANFFTYKSPVPAFSATQKPVSLERRTLVGTVAVSTMALPVLRLSAGESTSHKKLIRPPMSRDERDFLSSCIRCTECIKACPTGILKPAGFEHGVRAFWSPVMVATEGFCQEGCSACSQACPTDAIMKYPIEKKYAFKAGTAVFNSSQCISYSENKFCSECVRACPTNAIEYERGWEPAGEKVGRWGVAARGADTPAPSGQKPTRPVKVNFDKCVGCGGCEYVCNQIVLGDSAMVTTSFGRTTPTAI